MQTLETLIAPYLGMTFDQLRPVATAIGIPHGTLYRVVKGYTKNPRYGTLLKLMVASQALSVTPSEGSAP